MRAAAKAKAEAKAKAKKARATRRHRQRGPGAVPPYRGAAPDIGPVRQAVRPLEGLLRD